MTATTIAATATAATTAATTTNSQQQQDQDLHLVFMGTCSSSAGTQVLPQDTLPQARTCNASMCMHAPSPVSKGMDAWALAISQIQPLVAPLAALHWHVTPPRNCLPGVYLPHPSPFVSLNQHGSWWCMVCGAGWWVPLSAAGRAAG